MEVTEDGISGLPSTREGCPGVKVQQSLSNPYSEGIGETRVELFSSSIGIRPESKIIVKHPSLSKYSFI